MLIKALAWLFAPQKKTRSRSGGEDRVLGWLALAALIVVWVG